MTRRQRDQLVAVRTEFILADEPAVRAYTLHFERQLRRGKLRRLLYAGYLRLLKGGAMQADLDTRGIR